MLHVEKTIQIGLNKWCHREYMSMLQSLQLVVYSILLEMIALRYQSSVAKTAQYSGLVKSPSVCYESFCSPQIFAVIFTLIYIQAYKWNTEK